MKIKFTCNRTGFKKTFTVKTVIFDRFSMAWLSDCNAKAETALISHIQNTADLGFFLTVSGKSLNEFMLSSMES
jgi:hypothetical protein